MQPWLAETRAVAVNVIAHDRPTHFGRMNPQLMGAAGHRFECEPGKPVSSSEHLPFRHCLLTFRVRLLPPAAFRITASERHVDGARVFGRAAFDNSPISLRNLAVLEQQAKRGGRLAVAAEHEATGSVLVQSVCQHRRARQAERQRPEGGFQIGAALGAAMHGQSRWFVDHQHQTIAVKHAGEDFFCREIWNIHQRSRLSFAR